MKIHNVCKSMALATLLLIGAISSNTALAGFINADFMNSFDGWGGDVNYFNGTDEIEAFDIDFADFTDNFVAGAGSVTLNTSEDLPNEYWGVYLFQSFILDPNSLELSLSYIANADDVYVTLVDDNGDLLHDFITNGLSVDVSAWAGSLVAFEFGVEDFDFVYDDSLTVSNINLTMASVPEPSTMLLFALALLGLRATSFSHKHTM